MCIQSVEAGVHAPVRMRILKSFCILFLFPAFLYGQSSEIGLTLGISSYKGDLNTSLFNPKMFRPAAGFLYRRCINNHWAYKVQLNAGTITADDANSRDEFRKLRNLSFRSHIIELTYQFEFNFFAFQTANPETPASPYIFIGLSMFHFNPRASLDGTMVNLQPLGTEGQGTAAYPKRKPYKRLNVSIPLGGGFNFRLSNRFGLTVECGARRTYTDYLDDVSTTYADKDVLRAVHGETSALLSDRSVNQGNNLNKDRQRGNASDKDWYMFAGVTLNFTLSKNYNDICRPFKVKLH